MTDKNYTAHIALICDTAYVVPTCVTISSIVRSAQSHSLYDIIVVTAELSDDARQLLLQCVGNNADVRVITGSMDKFTNLHIDSEKSVRVASPAALLKFDLPTLLPELDKLLYLDSDIIVRGDLSDLYDLDLDSGHHLVAAAADSGQIYFKHEYVQRVERYFNSGVMLMNLALMRAEGVPKQLLDEKRSNPQSNLMDQNVFNVVMDGRVRYLEPRYNLLYMSLCNACQYYSMDQINTLFGTSYADISELERTAQIIHYSSKNKPWKTPCTALSDEWYTAYSASPCAGMPLERDSAAARPRFSILIYIHNYGPYIERCVASILAQTLGDFEVLLLENNSTDNSLMLAKNLATGDERLHWFRLTGSSHAAVNAGLRLASGEHVLFLEGCEILPAPDSLEQLDSEMTRTDADMMVCDTEFTLFDRDGEAKSFFSGEPVHEDDPISLCLSCELEGWPRIYRRTFLEANRLYFTSCVFRGPSFALNAARLAKRAARLPEVAIVRLFDSRKKLSAGSGSFADMAVYASQLEALYPDARYAPIARRRLDEACDIFCAARTLTKREESFDPPECYGAVEKILLRCGYLEAAATQSMLDQRQLEAKYNDVIRSTSYRLGMKLTSAPRYIKRRLSGTRD